MIPLRHQWQGSQNDINAIIEDINGQLEPEVEPDAPATGWILFTDSGDGDKLKAKASNGTVRTLATP